MSNSGRPLLAPQSSADDSSNQGSGLPNYPGPRPKRTLIESACAACRRRKSKCDGSRPVCSRCSALRTECVYEAEEGESRWHALRRRSTSLEHERDDLREILSWLLLRQEQEALEVFHRIRSSSYDEILAMARQSRESGLGLPPQAASSSSPEQRLPPIRSLVDVPDTSLTQMRQTLHSSEESAESYSSNYSPMEPPPPPSHPPST